MSNKILINALKELLTIGPKNELALNYSEFFELQELMQDYPYYDDEGPVTQLGFEEVKDYLLQCNPIKWEKLKESVDGESSNIFDDLEVKTLDDIQRAELLVNLYNETSSITELEILIKGKYE